jgi:uncharacterized protein YecE (DUF72 family)
MNVLSGTAAWSDQPGLYPPGLAKRDQLGVYAGHLPLVEVNSTFHALQPVRNFEKWTDDTPDGFVMNVKVYKAITGQGKDPQGRSVEELLRMQRHSINPLRAAGKFGAWLFQFPPWFRPGKCADALFDTARHELADDLIAIEVRHPSWFDPGHRDETLSRWRDLAFINVIVDEPRPELTGLLPTVPEVTNPALAYFRFMGRDALGPLTGNDTSTRHRAREDYFYTEEDWDELGDLVDTIPATAEVAHVIWHNNGASANAVASARHLNHRFNTSLPTPTTPHQPALDL